MLHLTTVTSWSEHLDMKICCCIKRDQEEIQHESISESKATKTSAKLESGWEQHLLDNNVLGHDIVQHAAIVTFPKGAIKAKNFNLNDKAVHGLIKAFEGDTSHILEGIQLSDNLPLYSPGKMEENVSIYGTAVAKEDEEPATGGCAIFKTNSHLLICAFDKDLEGATNFALKIADGMKEKGY